MTAAEKSAAVAAVPVWFHSFDFGDGVLALGHKTAATLNTEAKNLPDVRGKTVLDVNCLDGWFALECERRGAARVVAIDWFMWYVDFAAHWRYWEESRAAGVTPRPPQEMPYWKPAELPGKAGFDTAKRLLGSKVEPVVGDLVAMPEDELVRLGTFDVVLWLGSLYHMRDPLTALERVRRVTAPGGVAVVETEAAVIPGHEDAPLCIFHGPTNLLNGDPTNYWSPNMAAVRELCLAAGFASAEAVAGPPAAPRSRRETVRDALPRPLKGLVPPRPGGAAVRHYRAWVHARR